VAGFAAITLLGLLATVFVAKLTPSWSIQAGPPSPWAAFVQLGASFLVAAVGGYVTALTAAANSLVHVLALAMIVLALGALSALQSHGKLPVWFQLAQMAISPFGVLAGGLLRLRVQGIL
jgi:hypothetical protein